MKTNFASAVIASFALTSGLAFGASDSLPEQWTCANARAVSGLYSLEAAATLSASGQPWKSLDVFLVQDKNQSFDAIETYSFQPALTSVRQGSREVTIGGRNRQVLGKTVASLTIDVTRARRGSFSSVLLNLAGIPVRGATDVYAGTLMLDTGSSADANEIPMNCVATPTAR